MPQSNLFEPTTLGHIPLRNRTIVAPMTRVSADSTGLIGPLMQPYYQAFGDGGFGAIITEGVYTDQHFSQGYQFQPGITDAAQTSHWASLIKAVKSTGTKLIMQLMHAGGLSQFNQFSTKTCAPSALIPMGSQMGFYRGSGTYPMPVEMSQSDIELVVIGFTEAAKRAQDAGADGVEVHSANGYLLDQFLTDVTNQRDDCYGNSVENRIRLTCEIVKRIREVVGTDFTIGVRISQSKVNNFTYKWAGCEDDAKVIFSAIQASGADYIHTTELAADAAAFEQGKTLSALAKTFTSLPVIANGGLGDPVVANNMIKQGHCDFISLGKDALASPDWPNRVRAGDPLNSFNFGMFSPLADLETANAFLMKNA